MADVPRIRRASVPADAVLVVRGDTGDPDLTRDQAEQFRRRFRDWDRWGVSAFYARNDDEVDDLAADRLQHFEDLLLFRTGELTAAGFEVVPTFRTPHVTIAWSQVLDDGLDRLAAAAFEHRVNPYHVGGREDR